MPELPGFGLSRIITRAYRFDDFILVIIYGPLRMGKSAYAMKVLGEVYDYFFGEKLSPDLITKCMGFHPADVVESWMNIKKRIPMYVWDDAGYWLYSMDWNNPLLKAIQKYFNVIGTDMNCLLLTTPDPTWILSKLVNMPGTLRGEVQKIDGSTISDAPSKLYARKCRGYKPYRAPDLKKTGVNVQWEDTYSCYIPDDIYNFYQPMRRAYAGLAKQKIREVLLKQTEKGEGVTSLKDTVKNIEYLADK
jgi:hypothetical protein